MSGSPPVVAAEPPDALDAKRLVPWSWMFAREPAVRSPQPIQEAMDA